MTRQTGESRTNGDAQPPKKGRTVGRRRALKVGLAVAGGVALAETYVAPNMLSIGVQEAYAASPIPTPIPTPFPTPTGQAQGCTPGFWGNEGSNLPGGRGLWDELNDPEWAALTQGGKNPFHWATLFNDFFDPDHPDLTGFVMYLPGDPDGVVDADGGTAAMRAARQLVAAYLNASFGLNYQYTTLELKQMWADAVNAGTDAALESLKDKLDAANNAGCPVPGNFANQLGKVFTKKK